MSHALSQSNSDGRRSWLDDLRTAITAISFALMVFGGVLGIIVLNDIERDDARFVQKLEAERALASRAQDRPPIAKRWQLRSPDDPLNK